MEIKPLSILEIGIGNEFLSIILKQLGYSTTTMDIDDELNPDIIGSAAEIPLSDNSFELVCAFQVLEHLPYSEALKSMREMIRVSSKYVIISLPDAERRFPFAFYIPKKGLSYFSLPNLIKRGRKHNFDGQHHWELNTSKVSYKRFLDDTLALNVTLDKSFIVPEHTYHRFFIFSKIHD